MRGALRYVVFPVACISCVLLFAPRPATGQRIRGTSRHIWFTPNIGSLDMARLFQASSEWRTALAQVDVFKFYEGQLREPPDSPKLGPNHYDALRQVNAFRTLAGRWHKQIAIEVGVVKPQFCSPGGTAEATAIRQAIEAILDVEMAGGRVSYLAMDEPFYAGVTNPELCGGAGGAADRVARYVTAVKRNFPGIAIGLIEPYPYFRPESIAQFLDLMAARGVAAPFFHLDAGVDQMRPGRDDFARDVGLIASECASRGIRFGIIFNGDSGESNSAYAQGVMQRIELTKETFGTWAQLPADLVFQSWAYSPTQFGTVPANLPETAPDTHTNLIDRAMAMLRSPLPAGIRTR